MKKKGKSHREWKVLAKGNLDAIFKFCLGEFFKNALPPNCLCGPGGGLGMPGMKNKGKSYRMWKVQAKGTLDTIFKFFLGGFFKNALPPNCLCGPGGGLGMPGRNTKGGPLYTSDAADEAF